MDPVDVRDLLAEPGASRRLEALEAFPELRTELARVAEEPPVRIEVLLESVIEGILVSGPLSAHLAYRCARCLRDFSQDLRVEVRELFAPHVEPDDERRYPINEGLLDLEPMVRDAILLQVPFSPLCRPDCAGLCARCGGDRNLDECACGAETDPRWAVLDVLELDDN